jgi:hypothetical protein
MIVSSKEQLVSMMDYIGESEAARILEFIKEGFLLKLKKWDDIPEVEPEPDEIAAFAEYRAGR